MGRCVILVDTHVVVWMLGDVERLSGAARDAIAAAQSVAVADITWYELAWLIDAGRIDVQPSARTWLREAARNVTTVPVSWAIGHQAASLSRYAEFPRDPADRLIYASARERSASLVTKDLSLRSFDPENTVW